MELVPAERRIGDSETFHLFASGEVQNVCRDKKKAPKKERQDQITPTNEEPCCSYSRNENNENLCSSSKTTSSSGPNNVSAEGEVQLDDSNNRRELISKTSLSAGEQLPTVPERITHKGFVPFSSTLGSHKTHFQNVAPLTSPSYFGNSIDGEHYTKYSQKAIDLKPHTNSLYKQCEERKLENGFCGLSANNVHFNTNTL